MSVDAPSDSSFLGTVSVPWIVPVAGSFANFVVGSLVYGVLMSSAWLRAMNADKGRDFAKTAQNKNMFNLMAIDLFLGIIRNYVFARFLIAAKVATVAGGAFAGIWTAIGFYITGRIANDKWEDRPPVLTICAAFKEILGSLLAGAVMVHLIRG